MSKVAVLEMNQFANKQTANNDFYITTIANHLKTSHREISLPHKHNFYVTMLFTQGTGMHEIDFILHEVKPGSLFFLNPGQMHYWELSNDTDGFIILHTEQFYNIQYINNRINQFPFFTSIQNPPCLYINYGNTLLLSGWFKMAIQEKNIQAPFQHHKLASLLDIIYIECARIYGNQNNTASSGSHYNDTFARFEQLLENHFYTKKSPAAYTHMLNISTKHLNRITQLALSKTTSAIITDRVLLEAKRELIQQKQSFTQIAQNLGYDDYAYFSRLFKNKTGLTPSQFLSGYIIL